MGELVLTTYDGVQQALRRRALKQALYDEGGVIMRDALLTLHGREHRERRRLENRLFRREVFRLYDRELIPSLVEESVRPFVAAGRGDLLEIGHRTTLKLTALISGIDRPRGTPEETERLQGFVVRFSEGATLVHSTRDRDAVRREVREALEAFDEEFLQPAIARRRELLARHAAGQLDEGGLPSDVLTVLLRHQDEAGLTAEMVRREVAFFLQAGSHSSANAFTHAVDDLLTWFEDHPGDRRRARDDPRFLQRCVHESLRLHPASPVAWRTALEDVRLRDGEVVPAGTRVVLDLMAANRDAGVFGPDADRFDPHRAVGEGVPPWGHTFGGGMHVCIGQELDGGVTREQGGQHVLGMVGRMVQRMLAHGVERDPDDPPRWDDTSERPHFGSYPVRFGAG